VNGLIRSGYAIRYFFSSAEWIKQLFAIPIQGRFVVDVYGERFPVARFKGHVVLLRVRADKPFDIPQRNLALFLQNVD
jgi:hypothetical protein